MHVFASEAIYFCSPSLISTIVSTHAWSPSLMTALSDMIVPLQMLRIWGSEEHFI